MSDTYESTRVVAEYQSEGEAHAAVAALEAAGIEAKLTNDNAVGFSLFGRMQFAPIQLAVAGSRADEAAAVLSKIDVPLDEGWEATAENAVDGWLCRACDTVTPYEERVCGGCGGPYPEEADEDEE